MSVTRALDNIARDIHATARLKGKPSEGVAGMEYRLALVVKTLSSGQTKDCGASLFITKGLIKKLPPEERERLGTHTLLLQKYVQYHSQLTNLNWKAIEDLVADANGMQVGALKHVKEALEKMPQGDFQRVAFDSLAEEMHPVIWGLEDYFSDVMRDFDKRYKIAPEYGHFLHVLNQELPQIKKLVPDEPEFEKLKKVLEDVEVFLEKRSELMSKKFASITEEEYQKRLPEPHWTKKVWDSEAFQGIVLMGYGVMMASAVYLQANADTKLVDEKDAQRFCLALDDKFGSIKEGTFRDIFAKGRPQLDKALGAVAKRYPVQPNATVRQELCDQFRRTGHI